MYMSLMLVKIMIRNTKYKKYYNLSFVIQVLILGLHICHCPNLRKICMAPHLFIENILQCIQDWWIGIILTLIISLIDSSVIFGESCTVGSKIQ